MPELVKNKFYWEKVSRTGVCPEDFSKLYSLDLSWNVSLVKQNLGLNWMQNTGWKLFYKTRIPQGNPLEGKLLLRGKELE